MSGVSAAPSWVETTLQWIRENEPHLLTGFRGTNESKLLAGLCKANYALKESMDDEKRQRTIVKTLVANWGQEDHQDFRSFVAAGGYTPAGRDSEDLDAKQAKLNALIAEQEAATSKPAAGWPPRDPSTVTQDLEEAVAAEQLAADEEDGAW